MYAVYPTQGMNHPLSNMQHRPLDVDSLPTSQPISRFTSNLSVQDGPETMKEKMKPNGRLVTLFTYHLNFGYILILYWSGRFIYYVFFFSRNVPGSKSYSYDNLRSLVESTVQLSREAISTNSNNNTNGHTEPLNGLLHNQRRKYGYWYYSFNHCRYHKVYVNRTVHTK